MHRYDRVDEILAHLAALGCGGVKILDLVAVDDGRPVKRVIVQATAGQPHADIQRSRMVLHTADGEFTESASAILRDLACTPISEQE